MNALYLSQPFIFFQDIQNTGQLHCNRLHRERVSGPTAISVAYSRMT